MAGDHSTIEDELAIRRLLAEYCQYLDDGRFDDWIDLFSTDVDLIVMGMRKRGHDEVRDFIEPGGDIATSTVDFVWLSRSGEVGQIGRYHDTLVRHDDRWRFATREIVFAGDQPIGDSQQ